MKKHRTLWIILIILVVLAAAAAGVWFYFRSSAEKTQSLHQTVHAQYETMCAAVDRARLTVTEGGASVGSYDLQTLGLRESLLAQVTAQFSELDRMTDEQYAALSMQEKLDWAKRSDTAPGSCTVSVEQFDASAILADLQAIRRTAAQDAYTSLEDGVYTVHPEVPGNELDESAVLDALRAAAASIAVTADGPTDASLDITDTYYKKPAITTETLRDTPDSLFRAALAELELRISFNEGAAQYLPHGEQTLTSHALASIVDLTPDGQVTVDETVLGEKVAKWAADYSKSDTPFLFDSWVKGLTEIEFVTCDYLINAQDVMEQIRAQLLTMQSGEISVQAECRDQDGELFSLGDSYIEVDFDNQQMTFIKDGRLVVNTNVVTGALNGHQTPTGLYETHGKEHDVWLKGDDYLVFVKYWVSVVGDIIGLHDASWRSNFGASFYVYGGSHGCVNTPEEAMAMIWNLAEDGTPVLMHGVNQWYEPANGNPRETKDPVRGTTSKITVASGTRVLEPGSSRIEIQADDIVPFELPKPVEDGAANTESDPKPVS